MLVVTFSLVALNALRRFEVSDDLMEFQRDGRVNYESW